MEGGRQRNKAKHYIMLSIFYLILILVKVEKVRGLASSATVYVNRF